MSNITKYVRDAFKSLDLLEDIDFDLSNKDSFQKVDDFLNDDIPVETKVIDLEAENKEDLKDSYVGNVILMCPICHTNIFKGVEDIVLDKEAELCNIDEACPVCGQIEGFKIVGKVAPFEEEAEEIKAEVEADDNVKVEVEDKEVETIRESIKKRINNKKNLTEAIIKKELSVDELKKLVSDYLENDVANGIGWISTDYLEYSLHEVYNIEITMDELLDILDDMNYTVKEIAGELIIKVFDNIKDEDIENELNESLTEADKPAAVAMEDAQKWIDFDMERYGRISDRTNELVKRAGFQIIKDDYGDYEVAAGKFEELNCDSKKNLDPLNKKSLTEATRSIALTEEEVCEYINDAAKYFYNDGKWEYCDLNELNHYLKDMLNIDISDPELLYNIINNDCGFDYKEIGGYDVLIPSKANYTADDLKEIALDFGIKDYEPLNEEIERAEIETEDQIIKVEAEDKDLTEEEVHSDDEMIAPLSDEDIAEIETEQEAKEEPVEEVEETKEEVFEENPEDEEEFDFDEIQEESFKRVTENYLKKVYSNVKSFDIESVKINEGLLSINGRIKFNSGKSKNTKFVFEKVENRESISKNKAKFIGLNETFTDKKNAYILNTRKDDKVLVVESLRYNYPAKTSNLNESIRVIKGLVK